MTELITGLDRGSRQRALQDRLETAVKEGKENLYLMVPGQMMLTAQEEVLQRLGPSSVLQLQVVSFPSLGRQVLEEAGNRTEDADGLAQILFVSAALEQSSGELKAFGRLAETPGFAGTVLHSIRRFMRDGMGADDMLRAAGQIRAEDEGLADRLEDLAHILNTSRALTRVAGLEPRSTMERLPELLQRSGFLRGTRWYLNGFTDFTVQELAVVDMLLSESEGVTVCLPCGSPEDTRAGCTAAAGTARVLMDHSARLGCTVEVTRAEDRTVPAALSLVRENLCGSRPAADTGLNPGASLAVFEDTTMGREVLHAVGEILKAVQGGMRYRDISLVLCDYARYAPTVKHLFRQYGIPAFFGGREENILGTPVIQTVLCALNSAAEGLRTGDVLGYLKTGLGPLYPEQAASLEQYVLAWNIRGEGWNPGPEGWTLHPDGFMAERDEKTAQRLEYLNGLREKGVQPLVDLRDAFQRCRTVGDFTEALYAFLEKTSFQEKAQSAIDRLWKAEQEEAARDCVQAFFDMDKIMDEMRSLRGSDAITPKHYVSLFASLCASRELGVSPEIQDQVNVYSLDRARFFSSKLRLMLGADSQTLPSFGRQDGLFSAADAEKLERLGYPVSGTVEQGIERTLTEISLTLEGAKERLVMSCSLQNKRSASELVLRMRTMFPSLKPEAGAGEDGIFDAQLMHPLRAGELLSALESSPRHSYLTETLKSLNLPALQESAQGTKRQKKDGEDVLAPETVGKLRGDTVWLSSTRIDTFNACRFQEFLQRVLKLEEPQEYGLDPLVKGSFHHGVMEQVFRTLTARPGGLQISDEDLRELTLQAVRDWEQSSLEGLQEHSARDAFRLREAAGNVVESVRTAVEEARNSGFKPSRFEVLIGEGGDFSLPPLGAGGMTAKFTGRLDRLDTLERDGETLFRIVDYKASRRELAPEMLLAGRDIQMMLYGLAVQNSVSENGNPMVPAEYRYIPTDWPVVKMSGRSRLEDVEKERAKKVQRTGYLVSDYEPEAGCTGDLCSWKEDSLSSGDMELLGRYAEHVLRGVLTDMGRGAVSPSPVASKSFNPCTWCAYSQVCHRELKGISVRWLDRVKMEDALQQMQEILDEEEKDPGLDALVILKDASESSGLETEGRTGGRKEDSRAGVGLVGGLRPAGEEEKEAGL